jgi:hypothetical protein
MRWYQDKSGVGRARQIALLSAVLSLVATFAPVGTVAVRAAYNSSCAGGQYGSGLIAYDVTPTVYFINEVYSFVTVVHQYPCVASGGKFDTPYILGANLQYTNQHGPDIVQLGYSRCEGVCPSGWPAATEVLIWTPSDNTGGGGISLATWWNQGLGAGVLYPGDQYEMAILPTGSQWEYGVRDLTPGRTTGFTYHLAPNHWPVHTGGNFAWWGAEVNDWQSVLGNRVVDPSYAMTEMWWKESDNGKWNQISASQCSGLNGPWYYGCGTYNRTTLEGWTDDH